MAGYTDALVLEAPVFWWPSLGELTKYPLHPDQSFCASVTDAAMPWPCGMQSDELTDAALTPTVGLSRLGRSVWMTAEWIPAEDRDEQFFVRVWSPIKAETIFLPVSTAVGLGSNVATHAELMELDLRQLVCEGRVRLAPRVLPADLRRLSSSSSQRLFQRLQRRAAQHPAYPLLHGVLADVHASAVKHLMRALRPAASPALPAPALVSSFAANEGSFLFTGDTPSQRQLLDLLQCSTPPLLPLGNAHRTLVAALEVRRLNFAEVLTLREHEALETVEVALRPPPLAPAAPASRQMLQPCLLLILQALDLLEAQANSLVAGVTHQLCMSLEMLYDGPVPALTWAFAEETSALPAALRARVAAQHVRLSTTAPEDRTAYLRRRLISLQHVNAFANSSTATVAAETLAEETAHWTVDRLMRVRDAELLNMCASAPTAAGDTQESVHAVFHHLYGMDDDIRKVEELVVWPLTHLPLLHELAIPCAKGVLICGPSGSGKTALLSALVRRLQLPDTRNIHVLSVDGLSLIEKEVGRSEKNIAQLFETARALAPTALFIDNLDALAPPRGRTTAETNATADRTLSTLLTQMDGVNGQADRVVLVVASAPSIDVLDPAVCRPGRLDVHVHLRHPTMRASADFVKRRLHRFVAHVNARFGPHRKQASGVATENEAELVDRLVEDYFAGALAKEAADKDGERDGSADTTATPMSPAEVSAAVREVMLHVSEQLSQNIADRGDDGGGKQASAEAFSSVVQRYMKDAFAKLDIAQ